LILYIAGDNGSAGEGGPNGVADFATSVEDQLPQLEELGSSRVAFNLYGTGWAWLGNTPFKWWKCVASHFGGLRAPLVAWWPSVIGDRGGLRSQFTHVVDVAPTIYEVAGFSPPDVVDGVKQEALDGVSFRYSFEENGGRSQHERQYFETFGNRAIYENGWVAAAPHWVTTWVRLTESDPSLDEWELYDVERDFSQATDLASERPAKLDELKALFEVEAKGNSVLPVGAGPGKRTWAYEDGDETEQGREHRYTRELPRLPFAAKPNLSGRSYRIFARLVIPQEGAHGVLVSYGGRMGGFALYIDEGRVIFENHAIRARGRIASVSQLPIGDVDVTFEFVRNGESQGNDYLESGISGIGRIYINGRLDVQTPLSAISYVHFGDSLGIGRSYGSPVSEAFAPPFAFSGTLREIVITVK
jgi:arylsulfatase